MAEGDVELGPVDIVHTVQLLLNFDEEVQNRSKHHSRSIYMVPSIYRDLSPRSYTPRVVSIGPLHHEDEHLKGFEVQKATYMHNLFHKVLRPLHSTPEIIMKACVTRVSGSIDQIKACYIGMKAWPDSKLVEMMVTDACFILAFGYDNFLRDSSLGQNVSLYTHILLDMILIENQIPYFVLQHIFECTFSKLLPAVPLAKYFKRIQNACNLFEGVMNNSSTSSTHDHILGFIQKSYQNPVGNSSGRLDRTIKFHSAVELDRSGIRFSAERDAQWPMAMKFEFSRFTCFPFSWSKPTLKMPVLRIYDNTGFILRNLIMYEQASQVQKCVTSYMIAMDELIDTAEDVSRLVRSQVITSYLGSDEEAVDMINSVLKHVPFDDFHYKDAWKQMDEYYNAKWPKFIAELRRKYFSNPWSIIALIAGIALFVLTFVQTVSTVVQTVYAVKAVNDSKAA